MLHALQARLCVFNMEYTHSSKTMSALFFNTNDITNEHVKVKGKAIPVTGREGP
jgi:hypothetical protein